MNNNSIEFKKKYIKYKNKYIILKDQLFFTYDTKIKQIGGMGDHICVPNVHGTFESFEHCQASSEVVHKKSIYPRNIPQMNESETYTEYVTHFLDYLDSKSYQLNDLWMIIGANNNKPDDLSRFKDEYDISITADTINMKEPTLLSLYPDDDSINKTVHKTGITQYTSNKHIYELLVDKLKPSNIFSKIIYDWSTTKFILDDGKIFKELSSIKELIALKGKLYINTFTHSDYGLLWLKDLGEGYYFEIPIKDSNTGNTTQTVLKPGMFIHNETDETYKTFFGYNTHIQIRVLNKEKVRIYNHKAILKYMQPDGYIPKKKIQDHISNTEQHELTEKIDHHNETMNRLSLIFNFPEYTIEYIINGKYPNNSSEEKTSITQFYLITKKLNEPKPPLKATNFGRILPQKQAPSPSMSIENKRKNILLETLVAFEIDSINGFKYHKFAQENLARWAVAAREKQKTACVVRVLPGDWGDVTYALTKEFGACFAALNMANAKTPGGGYIEGSVAQEENMFRRTDCHFALVRDTFMQPDNTNKYTKEHTDLLNGVNDQVYLDTENRRVCIRGPEEKGADNLGYRFLENEEIFPFYELRAAAVDLRPDGPQLPYDDTEMSKRIAAQFNTLIDKGVRHVVLSAFGCGAFKNPAIDVAKIYYKELQEKYMHFDVVAFAIFNAGYGPDNFKPFESQFATWKVP